jgi:hypothetical protein
MFFVELGREVSPRLLDNRQNKAVITGILNNKFVVILKKDSTSEVVRLRDIVLNETVYNLEDLKNKNNAFFKAENKQVEASDFDRFKLNLEEKIVSELLKSKGY